MHKAVTGTFPAYDVVILGAGYAGLMAALRLDRKRDTLRIVLINASDRFLERVRLQESIVTEVTPRISSISAFLAESNIEFICGAVASFDADRRSVRVISDAQAQEIMFDQGHLRARFARRCRRRAGCGRARLSARGGRGFALALGAAGQIAGKCRPAHSRRHG